MYILLCSDGSYYTGSTKNLEHRLHEHQMGKGAKHTKSRLPVKLVYYEVFSRIDHAFYREKQIQKWSRRKKIALITNNIQELKKAAECKNNTRWLRLRSATGLFPDKTYINDIKEISKDCNSDEDLNN